MIVQQVRAGAGALSTMVGLPLRNNNRSLMPSLQVLLLPLACVASAAAATDEQSRQGSRVQQPDDAATTATVTSQDSRSRRLQEAAGGPSAQAVLLDLKADLEAGWTHNLLESWTAETVSSPLLRHVLGSIAFGSSASSSAGALRQGFLRQSGRGVDVRAVQRSLAGWQADDTVRAAHFWPDTLQPQC